MAETVDQRLEQFVPTFEQLISLGVFDRNEVQDIIRHRRSFEYSLQAKNAQPDTYLKYIEYETAVMGLTEERKANRGIDSNERLLSDADWPRHIHSIFSRATHHFSGNLQIWNLYIDFCQNVHSMKALEKVFSECVRFHGHKPEVWIRASKWEMFENSNVETAKTYMEQAIKRIPGIPELYALYAETLLFLAKQIEGRRELHGIEESSDPSKAPFAVFERAMEQCENKLDVFNRFLELFRKYELPVEGIVEKGLETGEAKIIGVVAAQSDDPIAKFRECLKAKPSRALQIEFAQYLCEKRLGDELAVVLDEIEDFSNEESEIFAKALLDCGKLDDAADMLEDDLVTPTLQRLKLRLISAQNPDFAAFKAKAEPLVRRYNSFDMNSDFLFYSLEKTDGSESWLEMVKQRTPLVTPEVAAALLKVTLLKLGPDAANDLLNYMLSVIVPIPKFIEVAIQVAKAQKVVDSSKIRSLHETNIDRWGKTSTEAWLSYAQFEFEQKDLKKLESIRWKAQHTLTDPSEFQAAYKTRFC